MLYSNSLSNLATAYAFLKGEYPQIPAGLFTAPGAGPAKQFGMEQKLKLISLY